MTDQTTNDAHLTLREAMGLCNAMTTNDEQAGYAAEPKGLIPSPNLPGVSYNAEGMPVNKDGKPIHDLVPMVSCGSDGCVDGKTTSGESCQNCGGRGFEPPKSPGEPSPRIRYAQDTTEPKREPMLSDAYILETFRVKHDEEPDGFEHGLGAVNVANHVRDFYEAKIASGELRVVKTARFQRLHMCALPTCVECDQRFDPDYNFCPGCGAKIVEV